jgi:hypothetical protein
MVKTNKNITTPEVHDGREEDEERRAKIQNAT